MEEPAEEDEEQEVIVAELEANRFHHDEAEEAAREAQLQPRLQPTPVQQVRHMLAVTLVHTTYAGAAGRGPGAPLPHQGVVLLVRAGPQAGEDYTNTISETHKYDLQYPGLRKRVLELLVSYHGPRIVLTQICVAMSGLVIHSVTDHWPEPISDLVDLFQPQISTGQVHCTP